MSKMKKKLDFEENFISNVNLMQIQMTSEHDK